MSWVNFSPGDFHKLPIAQLDDPGQCSAKNHEMLLRQKFAIALQFQADRLHLLKRLLYRHFV